MTLMCIERSQTPTHKGSFLQGGKSPVNLNQQQQQNNGTPQRRNSCSPPLSSSPKSQQQQQQGKSSNSSRYKTELCRPFEENGSCKYGDKCQFAHGVKELRSMARHPKYKTELCRTFHSTGLCPYGPRCHFIHNSEQAKKSLLTNLTTSATGPASPPPLNRPKALASLGSAGDLSPASSQGGTPTGIKSFEDLFQQTTPVPMSPDVFTYPQDFSTLVNTLNQRFVEFPVQEFGSDSVYDAVSIFNEGMLADSPVDNYSYQGGPVLDLFQTAPLTPTTPLDNNAGFFRLPIFDLFHNKQ